MASLRATCARESWEGSFRYRNPTDYNTRRKARAFWNLEGFDESNVNEVDGSGKTLLMHFCQYYHLTKALLTKKVDPNLACSNGCTALHYISINGQLFPFGGEREDESTDCGVDVHVRVAEMLIKRGATASLGHRNALGLTPLMYAAHNNRIRLVEYFLALDVIPRTEKIDALELLGAKQLLYDCTWYVYDSVDDESGSDGHPIDLDRGFNRLQQAMELRYENPNELCLKQCTLQNGLYNNYVESRTMEELLKIRHNNRALRAEAYLILQRLIPKEMMTRSKHDCLSHELQLDYSTLAIAHELGRYGNWEEGIDILRFLINFLVESSNPRASLVLRGIENYLRMVLTQRNVESFRHCVPFSDIQCLLQIVVDNVSCRKESTSVYNLRHILSTVVWITYTLICLYPEDEVFDPLLQILKKLVLQNNQWPENTAGVENDLQLYTCTRDVIDGSCNVSMTSVLFAFMGPVTTHPALELHPDKGHIVTRMFCSIITLDRVNTVNKLQYTDSVLHEVIEAWHRDRWPCHHDNHRLELILTVISVLIRHGFSWGQTDSKGRTITGILSSQPLLWWPQNNHTEILELLESLKRCDLQELAARVIRNHHIPYRGIIPKFLYKVIEIE